jgi:hypothetical protein
MSSDRTFHHCEIWGVHCGEDSNRGLTVVMSCSVVVGYQLFAGLCWLHLQDEMKIEVATFSDRFISYRNTTRRHNPDLDIKYFAN